MQSFTEQLQQVRSYFDHGDHHLGYRRLLDAAIETDNDNVYEATLRFCDWYDTIEAGKTHPGNQLTELLDVIGKGYHQPERGVKQQLLASGISKRYSRGSFALSPVDVSLEETEIIGLVGENGNGKTTLLRILYGELAPDTGTIDYRFMKDRSDLTAYNVRSRMAFIPQRPQAWYGSLMDSLQYASTFVGLKGRANVLWTEMIIARMGLRPFRTYTWGRISSGYKMRFELARTLLRKPEVLLLDEPLANLDMLAQQIILEDLKFLAQSRTHPMSIILSSQQLYEVEKVSDQVIFLQKGVARYQKKMTAAEVEESGLVIELETPAAREELASSFSSASLQKISFNGGVYILYFGKGTEMSQVLGELAARNLPIKYLRDISQSSRRFFDA